MLPDNYCNIPAPAIKDHVIKKMEKLSEYENTVNDSFKKIVLDLIVFIANFRPNDEDFKDIYIEFLILCFYNQKLLVGNVKRNVDSTVPNVIDKKATDLKRLEQQQILKDCFNKYHSSATPQIKDGKPFIEDFDKLTLSHMSEMTYIAVDKLNDFIEAREKFTHKKGYSDNRFAKSLAYFY